MMANGFIRSFFSGVLLSERISHHEQTLFFPARARVWGRFVNPDHVHAGLGSVTA